MKTKARLFAAVLLTLILSTGYVLGQDQSSSKIEGKGIASILTQQQKDMLKLRAEKQAGFRKDFRASISDKQKEILENPRVMPYERQKEFRASLTDQQVDMIKNHRAEIKKMKEEFRATLTPEQKAMMKKAYMGRRMHQANRFRQTMLIDAGRPV